MARSRVCTMQVAWLGLERNANLNFECNPQSDLNPNPNAAQLKTAPAHWPGHRLSIWIIDAWLNPYHRHPLHLIYNLLSGQIERCEKYLTHSTTSPQTKNPGSTSDSIHISQAVHRLTRQHAGESLVTAGDRWCVDAALSVTTLTLVGSVALELRPT